MNGMIAIPMTAFLASGVTVAGYAFTFGDKAGNVDNRLVVLESRAEISRQDHDLLLRLEERSISTAEDVREIKELLKGRR